MRKRCDCDMERIDDQADDKINQSYKATTIKTKTTISINKRYN